MAQDPNPIHAHARELQNTTRVLEHEVAALSRLESGEHESNAVFLHLAEVMYLEKRLIQQFLEFIIGEDQNSSEVEQFLGEMKKLEEPKRRLERALAAIREYEQHMNTLSGRLQEAINRANLLEHTVSKHLEPAPKKK